MDYSKIINGILANPNDPKSKEALKGISSLLATPAGKEIISNLSKGENAAKIQEVANAAKRGDINAAKNAANSLLNSKDGDIVAKEIDKIFGKK